MYAFVFFVDAETTKREDVFSVELLEGVLFVDAANRSKRKQDGAFLVDSKAAEWKVSLLKIFMQQAGGCLFCKF